MIRIATILSRFYLHTTASHKIVQIALSVSIPSLTVFSRASPLNVFKRGIHHLFVYAWYSTLFFTRVSALFGKERELGLPRVSLLYCFQVERSKQGTKIIVTLSNPFSRWGWINNNVNMCFKKQVKQESKCLVKAIKLILIALTTW